jgi:hypothetical protein
LGHAFTDPAREGFKGVAEAPDVGIDPALTVEDEGFRRVGGDLEAGEFTDELLGPGGDGVEVALERSGQVGLLQWVVAGDAAGEPLGEPPVDWLGNWPGRAQVVFLPTRTPYFSMSTFTT